MSAPVMLALSTFRQSDKAVSRAVDRAATENRPLVIVYVVDVNLARYFIGTDLGMYPELQQRYEDDVLREHGRIAAERMEHIIREAQDHGVEVRSAIHTGRFAKECLRIAAEERPSVIITTRSNRPQWVKHFFGSPVDELEESADGPVEEY
ncbi:universal stress protein [Kiritimatiella glycovorans]|uniref:Universal stress protein family protein n=1 Tax=Kiritimatiella glycovorans TaxID=1307763 RepID=A0A0G3ED81_9BACT|nr:universal stress protein [Kiritimatiella glycovorans]AKJ63307.1 Universal stress protein family protein [Kiritimatiella glycovorans]